MNGKVTGRRKRENADLAVFGGSLRVIEGYEDLHMIQIIFRIIGGLILFLGGGVLFAGILIATRHSLHLSAVSPLMFCIRLSSVVLLHDVIGMGLFLLSNWAALALSILVLYAGCWSLLAA